LGTFFTLLETLFEAMIPGKTLLVLLFSVSLYGILLWVHNVRPFAEKKPVDQDLHQGQNS
jgi:hypothetical protein